MSYETRHETIVKLALDICAVDPVNDWLTEQTEKAASDAASNTYVEGISNELWLENTLARLGRTDVLIEATGSPAQM